MYRVTGVVARGIVAGIVGATAMALWFLVIDGVQGVPFRTPAFIAHSLLGLDEVQATAGPIIFYTLVHYAAWIAVGLVVSWLLTLLETASPVLLGLVLGFALFDIVFYGSVVVTGVDIVGELGWPPVLVGNLAAGVGLMGFLHLAGATRPVTWWVALGESRVVREGIVTGMIGAGAVAAWFLIFDLARGQPLFTPGALGSALFLGIDTLANVQVSAATVTGYTVLHVGAFVLVGFLAATIVSLAEKTPPLILGAVLFFAAFEAFFMGALAMLAEFLLGALAWWTIAMGNLVAAAVMGAYLWAKHPKLRAALADHPLDRSD
ncbi:MAG: hypothetical protein PVI57_22220 [Gemmatimonadota bacterium]|jgi:hypothetical protein